jgi:F-type H+-transporting ATPase subunit delta
MQASDRVLAGRYARALFLAAVEKGEEAKVLTDLGAAHRALLDAAAVLKHPQVSGVEKKKIVQKALEGKTGATTLRFIELLIDKKRYELLPMMAMNLGRLIADKNKTAKAHVRTARPLSADAQQKLKDKLKNFAGKNIELDIKEDPEILGGVIVRLGDWVLDSSLRGQLKQLRENIVNGN